MMTWWKAPRRRGLRVGSSRSRVAHAPIISSSCASVCRRLRRRGRAATAFERGADRIDLEEVVGGDLANLRAAERGADDEAEQLEVAQRFANGPLADAELLRDPGLDDARARREPAVQDVFDQFSRISSRKTRRSSGRYLSLSSGARCVALWTGLRRLRWHH